MATTPMHIIVNPRAGRGAVERSWPSVKRVLDDADVVHEVSFTEGSGHAIELARKAIENGSRSVVAMGGDGTVHEVVNGMMDDEGPRAEDLVLGVLPSGTGCDFAKTFGIPQEPARAATHLVGSNLWGMLDVGRVRYRSFDGDERTRWFINVAEAGIGAHVVVTASKMPRWLGALSYRLAALKGIATFSPQRATIAMNARKARGVKLGTPLGSTTHEATLTLVVVANCQFFGGGLRVAPRAIPSDAMLDVLVGEGTKWDAVRALKKMPTGMHVPDETITEYLADTVRVDGPEPIAVEADGEALGTTPAAFDLLPAAIALKI